MLLTSGGTVGAGPAVPPAAPEASGQVIPIVSAVIDGEP